MEQRMVAKNEQQCIYYMKESNLEFYLLIPNCQQVKIVLGIFANVTDELVKSIPIQSDKAIVVPIISNQILAQINNNMSPSAQYVEQVLSTLINTAYKILTYNHIMVDTQILLNNNVTFSNFLNNFLQKHQGRVQPIELFPQVEEVKPSNPVIETTPVENKVTPSLETKVEEIMPTDFEFEEMAENLTEAKEPGFVSYVLLGVLVAVISLVFLYLII